MCDSSTNCLLSIAIALGRQGICCRASVIILHADCRSQAAIPEKPLTPEEIAKAREEAKIKKLKKKRVIVDGKEVCHYHNGLAVRGNAVCNSMQHITVEILSMLTRTSIVV